MRFLCGILTFTWLLTSAVFARPANLDCESVVRHIQCGDATLFATEYLPRSRSPQDRFPVVILANSWAANRHEYDAPACWLAGHGYLVFCYSARGFSPSSGLVDVGGAADMADLSHLIDWLLANAPADPSRIGMAGISYGAGLALLGAAHDPRIKTIAVMSGWAELLPSPDATVARDSVSEEGAPAEGWTPPVMFTRLLMMYARGGRAHLSHDTAEIFNNILHYRLTRKMQDWARERSPLQHIDDYNNRDVRILISSNLQDRQFRCGDMYAFYRQLRGTKRMLINQGQHGCAEGLEADGVVCGAPNLVWDDVHLWFDDHLKAAAPSQHLSLRQGHALVRPHGLAGISRPCASISQWPPPPTPLNYYLDMASDREIKQVSYYLGAGRSRGTGLLTPQVSAAQPVAYPLSAGLTVATSGVHRNLLLEVFTGDTSTYDLPWITMNKIVRLHTAVLLSPPGSALLRVRGEPQANLWVSVGPPVPVAAKTPVTPPAAAPAGVADTSNSNSNSKRRPVAAQIIVYLCDVDSSGVGTLVSYSPYTLWSQAREPNSLQPVSIRMNLTAYDVPAGHSLALLVGTSDPQYGMNEAWLGYHSVTVHTAGPDGQPASLALPLESPPH